MIRLCCNHYLNYITVFTFNSTLVLEHFKAHFINEKAQSDDEDDLPLATARKRWKDDSNLVKIITTKITNVVFYVFFKLTYLFKLQYEYCYKNSHTAKI